MNVEKRSLINQLIFAQEELLKRNLPEPYTVQMTQKTYRRLLDELELEFLVMEPSSKKPMVLGMIIEVIK